jgi:diadenosine tetraphosphate (Ap4A) HIT family hydrolase
VSGLEHLWAGWRSAYLEGDTPQTVPADADSCVFCRLLASDLPDTETHVVWRHPAGLAAALLNAYPYSSGHVMVMPVRHVGDLEALSAEEAAAMWAGVGEAVRAVKTAYRPDGLNVGLNLGRAAGAGVPGHLHVHALPRWMGDTNFMTSIADARVLPEPLGVTDTRLRASWPAAERSESAGQRGAG